MAARRFSDAQREQIRAFVRDALDQDPHARSADVRQRLEAALGFEVPQSSWYSSYWPPKPDPESVVGEEAYRALADKPMPGKYPRREIPTGDSARNQPATAPARPRTEETPSLHEHVEIVRFAPDRGWVVRVELHARTRADAAALLAGLLTAAAALGEPR